MRKRKQNGTIVAMGNQWRVRYWIKRSVNAKIERQKTSEHLGPRNPRHKNPPADIVAACEAFMLTVNHSTTPPEKIVTVGDFVENVLLPWAETHMKASSLKTFKGNWDLHVKPLAEREWLKNVETHTVQGWLNDIGRKDLCQSSLARIKSVPSVIFREAKNLGYFHGVNPAQGTGGNSQARRPTPLEELAAHTVEEIQRYLALLPKRARVAIAIAGLAGLRKGEIDGVLWENIRTNEIFVGRSIWNYQAGTTKNKESEATVPMIRQLREILEHYRLSSGNPEAGPLFPTKKGTPLSMDNLYKAEIAPAINRCAVCHQSEQDHQSKKRKPKDGHQYVRDQSLPEWKGWHAFRRGLATNLTDLGVRPEVIQRILRHGDLSTTMRYVKTRAHRINDAMATLEAAVPAQPVLRDTFGTLNNEAGIRPVAVN